MTSPRVLIPAILATACVAFCWQDTVGTAKAAEGTVQAIESSRFGADGEPSSPPNMISLNFSECDIRELLLALAMKQNANIVIAQDVMGKVSIHLSRVSLQEAVSSIAMAGGYECRREKGTYFVYKTKTVRDPQADRLQTRVFKLKFIKTDKVQEILGALPGIRTVKIHEDSKSLIVEDTPENVAKVGSILAAWDTVPKQVLIEAQILQISLTDEMSMGVDWTKVFGDVSIGTAGAFTTNAGLVGSIRTGVGSGSQFTAAINALQTKTKVNTLSSPKILAVNGKQAQVQVGGKQGYKTTTTNLGVTQETVQFLDTGTILDITPFIDDEGNIQLTVQPKINSVSFDKLGNPVLSTTSVSTTLMAKSNQTIFIGGLIENTASQTQRMIPWLGRIPFLGFLFGLTNPSVGKTELVVLITPQIMEAEIQKTSAEAGKRTDRMREKFREEPSVYNELREMASPKPSTP
jgi:type II secretory pathway component GspD/PulD (secretin)